jgi:sugar (pentulose or hexulose) kinase
MTGGASIYVIGCDVFTQSAKAILLDEEGRVVARAASTTFDALEPMFGLP